MSSLPRRPNLALGHPGASALANLRYLDTSSITLIAAFADHHSFRAVAEKMGTHQSTVSRQLDRIEQALGFKVVDRGEFGLTLNEAGRRLLPAARDVSHHVEQFVSAVNRMTTERADEIVLYAPEGLATYWIMPQLGEIRDKLAARLRVKQSTDVPQLGRGQTELSIQYAPSASPDTTTKLLGHLRMLPYVSREFARRNGMPDRIDDLGDVSLVSQLCPFGSDDFWFDIFDGDALDFISGRIDLYTASGTSQYLAIESGNFVGALPSYSESKTDSIIAVSGLGEQYVPIYAVVTRDKLRDRNVRRVLDWLEDIFSEKVSDYFSIQQ